MEKRLVYFLLLLFLACEPHVLYQNKHQFEEQTWNIADIQYFDFHINDHTQAYDIILLVNNHINYPYQNLFVAYELQTPQNELLKSGLNNCMLFDPKTGKPFGKGWLNTKNHQFVLLQDYRFAQPGNYRLALTQFMRTDALVGIKALGICIKKAASAQVTNKKSFE